MAWGGRMAMITGPHMAQPMTTTTIATIIMTTDPHLTLAQWFSPAFPVGAFAYSHGLEWSVNAGDVTDRATAQSWITTVLLHGAGWNDALFVAAAYRAKDPAHIDALARAFAASSERLRETDLQGAAFARAIRDVWGLDVPDLTYPVAVGCAARLQNLPLDQTLAMYLHGFMANLCAAAMRLVPLGQTDGHRIIHLLTPECTTLAKRAEAATLDDLTSTAFWGDIAAMKHETQYSRIFRT